ncbi:hypothetical protein DC366_01325 [Pelagivirga sediminicola]|uniref:Hedgehog/Intein (Hint) domain-containing protein n=1 Tax=Pelagivirga sediminicola TaxID=2170575 RepID=A0A2T7GB35_9RHOB|nr:Hint domain-containing protein [Pelagivirga sediminicola]PVA11635.1 hypothetical protein DC366_01325 [Pelagivirga sediminicola]
MARVADYEFDGTGTTAGDSAGTLPDAQFKGGGDLDGAGNARFDGVNDFAVVQPDPALDLAQGTVIIEFVQHTTSAGNSPYGSDGAQTLFSVDAYGYGPGGGHLAIYIRSDGQVGVRHQDSDGSHYMWGGAVATGQPSSIGYSWGPEGTKLVVNGVEVASSTNTHLHLAGNEEPLIIGASRAWEKNGNSDSMTAHFDGTISRVQIHDQAMATSTPVPCFTAGTMIRVPGGERPVESLQPGDLILTADHGPQPVQSVTSHRFRAADLAARPGLRPVRIAPGRLGNDGPLIVSRQHALLLMPDNVLIRAIHLGRYGGGSIRVLNGCRRVDYHHLLLERHEIVFANGAAAESLLPQWDQPGDAASPPTARPILTGREARARLPGLAARKKGEAPVLP